MVFRDLQIAERGAENCPISRLVRHVCQNRAEVSDLGVIKIIGDVVEDQGEAEVGAIDVEVVCIVPICSVA